METNQRRTILPICKTCGRAKAPDGRDVSPEAAGSYCHWDECEGYYEEPYPGSKWPGEEDDEQAELFVHRSGIPLEDVPLEAQGELFSEDCEGGCGL